jgi:putative transposase
MLFYGMRNLPRRFRLLLCSLQQSDILPFFDALTEEQIQTAFEDEGVSYDDEDLVFTPAMTLWGFLSQALHKAEQRSCLAAVARIGVLLVVMGRPRCAENNGPYCRARGRLPLAVIERLTCDVARRCEAEVPDEWLWKGRHVKLADGTTVTMADTEENQEAFPQQSCQKKGLGFPIARLVVLLSLATAMTTGMAMAPYAGKETGELALLRELFDQLDSNDVLLADKLYCAYFTIALLVERQVDMVVRLHHLRKENVCRTRRLSKKDSLIIWPKPACPKWMNAETYARMPESLQLRLIHVRVAERGFRTESIDIVTTLTDAEIYSREEIADLYRARWLAELDIRSIKCTMGMDQLRCKSPKMVRKEIWTCLLAYNMIRQKILQSALQQGVSPRAVSFTNALQMIAAAWMVMPLLDRRTSQALLSIELERMADQTVGNRPNRIEPRAVKRRPKPYRLLTMLRATAQALLRRGIDPYKKQR